MATIEVKVLCGIQYGGVKEVSVNGQSLAKKGFLSAKYPKNYLEGLFNRGWKIKSTTDCNNGGGQIMTLEGSGNYEIIWEGNNWKFKDA